MHAICEAVIQPHAVVNLIFDPQKTVTKHCFDNIRRKRYIMVDVYCSNKNLPEPGLGAARALSDQTLCSYASRAFILIWSESEIWVDGTGSRIKETKQGK